MGKDDRVIPSHDSFIQSRTSTEETKTDTLTGPLPTGNAEAGLFLIVLQGVNAGKMYRLDALDFVIGRALSADLQLDDDGVSRSHARIRRRGDLLQIDDLGSTNGTYVNGSRIDTVRLQEGDKIQIGRCLLKLSRQDSLEEQYQRQLYESAVRDGLTQLFNRRFLVDRLRTEFSYCTRHRVPLSLYFIDVDHFKKVNDTYGHLAGDAALRTLARTIGATIRAEDMLARYGGEEMALLARDNEPPKARAFAERLRELVSRNLLRYGEHEIRITISIGVATLVENNYDSPEALLRAADEALYRAKEGGRNRVESAE